MSTARERERAACPSLPLSSFVILLMAQKEAQRRDNRVSLSTECGAVRQSTLAATLTVVHHVLRSTSCVHPFSSSVLLLPLSSPRLCTFLAQHNNIDDAHYYQGSASATCDWSSVAGRTSVTAARKRKFTTERKFFGAMFFSFLSPTLSSALPSVLLTRTLCPARRSFLSLPSVRDRKWLQAKVVMGRCFNHVQ